MSTPSTNSGQGRRRHFNFLPVTLQRREVEWPVHCPFRYPASLLSLTEIQTFCPTLTVIKVSSTSLKAFCLQAQSQAFDLHLHKPSSLASLFSLRSMALECLLHHASPRLCQAHSEKSVCYWDRGLVWRSNPIQFGKQIELESPEENMEHENPSRLHLRSQACQTLEVKAARHTQNIPGSLVLYVAMPLWLWSQQWTWATTGHHEYLWGCRGK